MIKRNLLVSLTTLSLLPITSEALDIGVTVDVESEFTTNTALTETNELEEWIHKPGINFSASHEAPNLTLEADYSFEHRFYQEDLFEDESATTGRADILWNAIPERLDFTVRNTRTETPIEAIDAATPSNRQETSNTEAGPTLRFHTRGDDEFQLEYLFGARSSDLAI